MAQRVCVCFASMLNCLDSQHLKMPRWENFLRLPGQHQDPGSRTAINGSDLKKDARQRQQTGADDSTSWEVTCGVRVWAHLLLGPGIPGAFVRPWPLCPQFLSQNVISQLLCGRRLSRELCFPTTVLRGSLSIRSVPSSGGFSVGLC